jgi:hypothetical protein
VFVYVITYTFIDGNRTMCRVTGRSQHRRTLNDACRCVPTSAYFGLLRGVVRSGLRSRMNSETGSTPEINRSSLARVHAT